MYGLPEAPPNSDREF
jgi:TetR/AcrR family transcriptional regulator, transcriptional repressor for nem operon